MSASASREVSGRCLLGAGVEVGTRVLVGRGVEVEVGVRWEDRQNPAAVAVCGAWTAF
jgi:hypothetical protein